MKLCKRCNKKVLAKRSDALFCSAICRGSYRQEQKKEEVKIYKKQYYSLNKEKIGKECKDNYYANKQKIEKRTCSHCNIEYQPTRTDRKFCSNECGITEWNLHNKEHVKTWSKNRYHTNINHKLRICLRSRLNKALKGNIKSKSTMLLLGCSIDELKTHLEAQFEPWMNWDNHGRYNPNVKTWNVDHMKPMAAFNLSDPIQQNKACHYTNLQPLLAKSNLIKGAKCE